MTSQPSVEGFRRAKRPRTLIAGPYGRPAHPALVTVPIGAWLGSLVLDVRSRTAGPSVPLGEGSTVLIGVGVAGAASSVVLGFLDLIQIPAGTHAMRVGLAHMSLNVTATTLYLGNFLLRRSRPANRRGVPTSLIALSGSAFTLVAVSGHLGGKLAYRYGVRVADEADQCDGYGTEATV